MTLVVEFVGPGIPSPVVGILLPLRRVWGFGGNFLPGGFGRWSGLSLEPNLLREKSAARPGVLEAARDTLGVPG
jgi:hypothetical protein